MELWQKHTKAGRMCPNPDCCKQTFQNKDETGVFICKECSTTGFYEPNKVKFAEQTGLACPECSRYTLHRIGDTTVFLCSKCKLVANIPSPYGRTEFAPDYRSASAYQGFSSLSTR